MTTLEHEALVSGEVNLQTLNAEQKEYLCASLFIRKIVLYNDKIEIHFNTPLRNGPDDDRGCSFFVGVGYLPRATLHKDECEADIIKIEMLAG